MDLLRVRTDISVLIATILSLLHDRGNVHALAPQFDALVYNISVVEGREAVLPCNVKHLGNHKVAWEKGDGSLLTFETQRITFDTRFRLELPYIQDWNLHLDPVESKDSGRYSCIINTNPAISKDVDLYVKVPPKIVTSTRREVVTREGENVFLLCNATGVPPPTIEWFRKPIKQKNAFKERIDMVGGLLVIYNVSRACDDMYECVASNGVKPAVHREMMVSVEFPPEATVPTQSIGQELGKTTMLVCDIEAYPLNINHWEFNGKRIMNVGDKYVFEVQTMQGERKVTISLTIHNIDEEDYGDYICVGGNKFGEVRRTVTLYMLNPLYEILTTITDNKPSHDQPAKGDLQSTTPFVIDPDVVPLTDSKPSLTAAPTKPVIEYKTIPAGNPPLRTKKPITNTPKSGERKDNPNGGYRSTAALVTVLVTMTTTAWSTWRHC